MYFTTYRVDGWTGELQPPPTPTQVGHYRDMFHQVDGVWLLASRDDGARLRRPDPHADAPG